MKLSFTNRIDDSRARLELERSDRFQVVLSALVEIGSCAPVLDVAPVVADPI